MVNAKKGYLVDSKISPSQLKTYLKSKKEYIKYYIKGENRFKTKYMDFGSDIHKAIELGYSDDEVLNMMITLIPRLNAPEAQIQAEIGKVILNGIIDSYDSKNGIIIDYKTGKKDNWSQKIVEEDIQFKFYALMHKVIHKKNLKEIVVVHLITEEKDGEPILTGEFEVYKYKPNAKDLKFVESKIDEFVKWVENLTENDLNQEDLPNEVQFKLNEIEEIKKAIDNYTEVLNSLKDEMIQFMTVNGREEIKTEHINLYWTSRKSWEYSKDIEELKKQLDIAKSEFEKTHQPKTITKSLNIRLK